VKKRNGLSKGYGFVEFDNEADQQKALKDVNGKIVDGRDLSVKVALTDNREDNGKDEEEQETTKETSPAPTEKKQENSGKKETPKTDSPKTEKKEEKK